MLIVTIAIQLRLTFRFQFGPFFKPFAQVQIQQNMKPNLLLIGWYCCWAVTIAITIDAGVPHELFTILNRLYCYQLDSINVFERLYCGLPSATQFEMELAEFE